MIQDDGHDGDDDRQRDDLRVGLQTHCRSCSPGGHGCLHSRQAVCGPLPSSLAAPKEASQRTKDHKDFSKRTCIQ